MKHELSIFATVRQFQTLRLLGFDIFSRPYVYLQPYVYQRQKSTRGSTVFDPNPIPGQVHVLNVTTGEIRDKIQKSSDNGNIKKGPKDIVFGQRFAFSFLIFLLLLPFFCMQQIPDTFKGTLPARAWLYKSCQYLTKSKFGYYTDIILIQNLLYFINIRGKTIFEQLSRTRLFTVFESPALFFPATQHQRKEREIQIA